MASLKHWISAARLRTLPLAFAVIALGTGLAYKVSTVVDWWIFALAVLLLVPTKYYQIMLTIWATGCAVRTTIEQGKSGPLPAG